MNKFKPSISEENGLKELRSTYESILSIGISTGGSAEIQMVKRHPDRHVIATTLDQNGLNQTQAIIQENKLQHQITCKLEDVSKPLPYPNTSFDFIYARLVLHYLDNQALKNTLAELYRILKPNGRFFIVVRSVKDWEIALPTTTYCEETGITTYPDYRTIDSPTPRYIKRRFHSPQSITHFLNSANFTIDRITEYNEQLYHDYMRKERVRKQGSLIEVLCHK